jgi:glycosyltransferase involved in cell wall biosynthesis
MTETTTGEDRPTIQELADDLRRRGVRRIHTLAWRDLDDDDAGGSEVHADEFMRRWAAAGLEITHRTSFAVGRPEEAVRNGYRVIRRGSRYTVFPRTIVAETARTMGPYDALVEIWNGVPWFSPVWCRRPRITFLHHIHGPMWDQILPGPLAAFGRALEDRIAPPFYRRTMVVTPSDATRDELLELGFRSERVLAVPNGVGEEFQPAPAGTDAERSAHPLVVAVGRFAPVKRFDELIRAAHVARRRVPDLELELVGSGPMLAELRQLAADLGATDWVTFHGYVEHAELVALYRRAWVVSSASLAEGWGLTLTEAAACGTPAVASDISGHRCSVVDGETGLLAPLERLGDTMADVLLDDELRARLGRAALARARTLTWESSARSILEALHAEVVARSR